MNYIYEKSYKRKIVFSSIKSKQERMKTPGKENSTPNGISDYQQEFIEKYFTSRN